MALLCINDLHVHFRSDGREFEAVRGADIVIEPGEIVALVGESGSGKTQTMMAAIGMLPENGRAAGSVRFDGDEILGLPEAALNRLRGGKVTMIFQEPASALDPLLSVGKQIMAPLIVHGGLTKAAARRRALDLLALVGLEPPERRFRAAPHQLSGGQRQRVMIAMAIANNPALLIADEPTTALDVTVQAQILDLLRDLQRRLGMAIVLITHDFAVVRLFAERLYVMEAGAIVESGPVGDVMALPRAAATRALIEATPPGAKPPAAAGAPILLEARDVTVDFPAPGAWFASRNVFRAVDRVSFILRRGQTLGVVGESGSGKSTLARALLRLAPYRGVVRFEGRDLSTLGRAALRALRRDMQLILQDPFGSLSPRLTIDAIVAEGLLIHEPKTSAAERMRAAAQALEAVGLDAALLGRYPHELSGGQRQRVAIARAMILQPRLIVLDEPTSSLDRTAQKDVLALLRALQEANDFSYLLISHDLAVIRAVADEVLVMRDGRIVERGPTEQIFSAPHEEYTKRLLESALILPRAAVEGDRA
jgi:ABC-type microcin C transport system duplicated ATPase subunit YejF